MKNESKLVPKRCRNFGQNGLPKWSLKRALSKVPPDNKKHHFGYQFSIDLSYKMQLNVRENRSTATIVKIISGRNCRELRPCRCSYSPREAAAQYTASQETTSKNWREFRPRQRLFFRCIGHTVLSRAKTTLRKSARVLSMQMTVYHSASAAQYTAERQAIANYAFVMYQPMHLRTFRPLRTKRSSKCTGRPAA